MGGFVVGDSKEAIEDLICRDELILLRERRRVTAQIPELELGRVRLT
jgi:hypothetical protein